MGQLTPEQPLIFLLVVALSVFFLGRDTSMRSFVREKDILSVCITLVPMIVLIVFAALGLGPKRVMQDIAMVFGTLFFAILLYVIGYSYSQEEHSSQNGEY